LRDRNRFLAKQAFDLEDANTRLQDEMYERARAQRALQESESHFRNAFDFATIGMALVSLQGRWLQVNRALCQIIGYGEDELARAQLPGCHASRRSECRPGIREAGSVRGNQNVSDGEALSP
jgi:PAS domain-containing protein